MRCHWKEFLSILPARFREPLNLSERSTMQELRCRIGMPPEIITPDGCSCLQDLVTQEDLDFIINAASRYSPWNRTSMSQGFLTAPGGHRIGVSGEVVYKENQVVGMKATDSICIRIARDFPGISRMIDWRIRSVLILGAPGWGKTTLLRDLIRTISQSHQTSVVDERGELFPQGFQRGRHMDVLTGCPKSIGIERMLRTMGPQYIAVDEITSENDCNAIINAANCGINLVATAHAGSMKDFLNRAAYQPVVQNKIFQLIVIMKQDKSFIQERMEV